MNEFERVKELTDGLPAPRPESRDAARAALVARFEAAEDVTSKPAPRRFARVRNLAFAGAGAAVAAALLVALGTGGGSGVRTEVADAADLTHLAELSPHLEIAGGWQITDTEVSPGGGATRFHYEREISADETAAAEIQWHAASVEELGQQLEGEGFEAAGTLPTSTSDALERRAGNWDKVSGTAQVYVSREEGESFFQAVGLWRERGWTFELSARLDSLDALERLLERVEFLGLEEWLIAIRPGGAMWLRDTLNGTVEKVETVKTEMPDGSLVYMTRAFAKTPEQIEELDFTSPILFIHRDGDNVRVAMEHPPGETPESP
jgi:hypothetical protein